MTGISARLTHMLTKLQLRALRYEGPKKCIINFNV
jgi:hypothetical protein